MTVETLIIDAHGLDRIHLKRTLRYGPLKSLIPLNLRWVHES